MSCIDSNKTANEIIEEVTILKAINWILQAWRSVKGETIINCFKQCGFQTDLSSTPNPHQNDQEFEDLLNTLSTEDFNTSEPTIDPSEVDWRESSLSQCLAEVIGENYLSESVESDNSDDESPIGVMKALKFMDQVQGLTSSIGNPDMM